MMLLHETCNNPVQNTQTIVIAGVAHMSGKFCCCFASMI